MVVVTKYHVIAGFIIMLFMAFISQIPHEQTAYDAFENRTDLNPEIAPEQTPLMSTPDNLPADDKPGWWKNEGHNGRTSGYEGSQISDVGDGSENDGGDNNSTGDGDGSSDGGGTNDGTGGSDQEIPEFPFIALPVMIVFCTSMLFSRK